MHALTFTLITLAGAMLAGLVGALTGLGGGVVLVPLLTLGLGVDIRYAIGSSLVCVIATSSGAAAAGLRAGGPPGPTDVRRARRSAGGP